MNGFDHQLLLVSLEGRTWAADVGFGSAVCDVLSALALYLGQIAQSALPPWWKWPQC